MVLTAAWLKRRLANLAIGTALGLTMGGVMIRLLGNRLIFPAPRYPQGFVAPEAYGLQAEEVWIVASDGVRLNAWFFAHPSSSKVLLIFHGNAENIGTGLGRTNVLSSLGLNILAPDYRGYGKSEGSPDEAGVYRDAEAAYRYLIDARGFQPRDIIVHGVSLGGAVAIDLASRFECGGLIAESTFTSARAMARHTFLIPLYAYVPQSRFDSIAKISKVKAPVLVMHGTRDELIPFAMGEQLSHAAPEPKSFVAVEGAGHNDLLFIGGDKYVASLQGFVGSLAAR
jgi:fermentation-respiration switch protein FrsA (DUF1100 family)